MPSLQIRDLPSDVYEGLAYRAKRAGRSLAQQALAELRNAGGQGDRRQRRLEVLGRLDGRAAPEAAAGLPSPEELVRQDRER